MEVVLKFFCVIFLSLTFTSINGEITVENKLREDPDLSQVISSVPEQMSKGQNTSAPIKTSLTYLVTKTLPKI